ncbi:hypothetical protein RCH14_001693 [Massilia sp. MP_M2]|uniref:flocculation-associated PEP-CTERM protein PepA n=1 Tax=Massilia sp. MP_M2 TaxID=3071713 RepID=UPI00319E133F
MNAFKKTIVATSIAAAAMFAGATAQAASFNPFTINPVGSAANFQADKITGNYTEIATFNEDGTFNVSLYWRAGQFVTGGGNVPLEGGDTGLGFDYGIYALYKASGTVSVNGNITTFNFAPSAAGDLKFMLDAPRNNVGATVIAPTTGSGDFIIAGSGDDTILATGEPLTGLGTLNPGLSTCGNGGINCGSFGSNTTFNLTAAGAGFFIAPNPFYSLSFQSGQLNNFNPTGTQTINGSLDVVFSDAAEVPEPASVGLLGLGMLGLYAARRRNKKAA